MRKTFLTLLCVSSAIAHAADEDITFHGTLLSPPTCSISGGKTIEVEFRDLIIDDINGNYGRKEVPSTLSAIILPNSTWLPLIEQGGGASTNTRRIKSTGLLPAIADK
ncbi:fimbrial protein, partial [Escherichia sp. HC-CC]